MAPLYPLSTYGKVKFFYYCASFTLWFCCFARFLILLPLVGRKFLPGGMADFFHVVSAVPLIGNVINLPSSGWRGSSLYWSYFNSLKMIALCYLVIFPHPKIAKHTSYSFLIVAWSVSNIIHTAYYAFKTKTRTSPRFLFWLKYHHFYVTFPIGHIAEMVLLFLSLIFVEDDLWYELSLKGILLSYIPMGYFFWGHLKNKKKKKYDDIMEKRRQGRTSNPGGLN